MLIVQPAVLDAVDLALRLALSFILVSAAFAKVRSLPVLVQNVGDYALLPAIVVRPFALSLPIVELLCGLGLFLGLWLRATSLATFVLLATFAVAVGVNLIRKRDIPCGCFGTGDRRKIGWNTLARVLLLMIYSGILAVIASDHTWLSIPASILIPGILLGTFASILVSLIDHGPELARMWRFALRSGRLAPMTVAWRRDS